ncbi:PREDICTED: putative disease resistance RPP13-like protein 1 [Populus euphratica]|uniref:Disease resistance RPP13-like protein 1 n=1 Tax=Populus euphratica TaxID=75702 RepID=A0AAJ6UAM6_POPEU|nr:PREDICTED: putative disease resistance RPP13-like protein 1 [Populus euphratica]
MDTKNEEISTRSRDLRNSCGERYHRSGGKITPTTSILDGSNVYGREKDIEVVLGWLLKGEAATNGRVFVVAIGGKEGVGKTTLAQLVYNNDTVVNAFDLRAWVFDNSKDFDVVSITRTILLSVTDACNCSDNLNLLQVRLREKLSGKSCLIVLDHVCDLDYQRWDLLCQPFAGSEVKIVVTTRNNSIPSIMAAVSTHHLEVLTDVDCLSMLVDHAKAKSKFDTDPKLQAIMEKIARKCKGLPQAAKHFGGRLLSTHYTEWEKIYMKL